MKNAKSLISLVLFIATLNFVSASDNYKTISVDAPFKMEPIKEYIFPNKDFVITKYGAKPDGKFNSTKAIAKAIKACNKKDKGW